MKAIVSENHQSRVEEVPLPTLQSGDLLLQVNACGVCFSDVHKIRFQKSDRPSILGHEVAGKVVETGGDVTKFKNGDRVVVAHHVPCLRCHYCRHGNISMCPQFKKTNLDPGGFAEFVRVPALHVENVAFRVPPGLSDNEASFMEPLGCALRAAKRAGIQSGDLIVLVGLGSIGLLLLQVISHLGAECIGIELDPERREFAKRFGLKDSFASSETELNDCLAQKTDGRGADGVVFTAGSPALVSTGLTWLRQGGTCTIFASLHPDSNVQLDWNQLYYRELNVISSYSAAPIDLAEALDLLGKRNVRVNELTRNTFPLEQFTDALAAIESRAILKAIMIPHG